MFWIDNTVFQSYIYYLRTLDQLPLSENVKAYDSRYILMYSNMRKHHTDMDWEYI